MEEIKSIDEEELSLGEEQQEIEEIDFSTYSKEDLLGYLKGLTNETLDKVSQNLHLAKRSFDKIYQEEKTQALDRFKADGGKPEDFDYRLDDVSRSFEDVYQNLSEKVKSYKSQQKELQSKLKLRKAAIVEELRVIVHENEMTNSAYNKVKELQQEWREANESQTFSDKELWLNYKALLDIYYNNRSFSFELKELDRKKNLEAKTELCEKAEALITEEVVPKALKELSKLHQEYKVIGLVPESLREELWTRFKTASDKLYERRGEYEEALKEQYKANYDKKLEVVAKLDMLLEQTATKISEWNEQTTLLGVIQDEWNALGPVPKEVAKEISRSFWAKVKTFFKKKGVFFNELDAQRGENLKKKEALCEKVEALKDDEHFKDTAEKIKRLQAEWKECGPVSKKDSDAIYKRFRAACDYFFDRRKKFYSSRDEEFVSNLKSKEELLTKIESLKEGDVSSFKELVASYDALGFVPREKKEKIAKAYTKITKSFMESLPEGNEKDELEIEVEFGGLKGNPQAANLINKRKDGIRRKISDLKNDINTLNTNIEFFARSKNADGLRKEVEGKIAKAEEGITELKRKLQLINSFEK